MDNEATTAAEKRAREIVEKISNSAIELAFTRHSLTTTDYEETDYPDVEEGVEAFKELVEGVKTDVLACLTGDDTGCLDPEDVDYDNEMEWVKRRIASALTTQPNPKSEGVKTLYAEFEQWWKSLNATDGYTENDSERKIAEAAYIQGRADQSKLFAASPEGAH